MAARRTSACQPPRLSPALGGSSVGARAARADSGCERRPRGGRRRREAGRVRAGSGGSALHRRGACRPRARRPRRMPALEPCGLRAHARPRPRRDPGGAGDVPRPRARPRPLRPHARLSVHVLPRCRGGDGARPRAHAARRFAGAALWRRPPVERRRLRLARALARLRPQRLRRNAARPVRVGREAPRGELRDRGPRPRLHGHAAHEGSAEHRPRVPRVDAETRPRRATSRSGTPASTSRRSSGGSTSSRRSTRRRPWRRPPRRPEPRTA